MTNLILGTATFGTGYGVANNGVRLNHQEVHQIVSMAQRLGINEFDTAPSYGKAEIQLGEFLDQRLEPKVSSKISKDDSLTVKLMLESVKDSLKKTKASRLANLYLHDPEALSGSKASEVMLGFKEILALGLVDRIGVSVYSIDSLLKSKEKFPELTVFQVPENICDRRMLDSSELMALASEDNHFIVRSIFLQGLLLMSLDDIPPKLEGSKPAIAQLKVLADSHEVSTLDLCLSYGRSIPWAKGIIIGSASVIQLRQIAESRIQLPFEWYSKIGTIPEEILDPRRW
jgi:aryl-alcohol dehydrogenase-like predicted oxidoreductase